MLASAVGIDRERERHVWRLVAGDDALRLLGRDGGARPRSFLLERGVPAVVERRARDSKRPSGLRAAPLPLTGWAGEPVTVLSAMAGRIYSYGAAVQSGAALS